MFFFIISNILQIDKQNNNFDCFEIKSKCLIYKAYLNTYCEKVIFQSFGVDI